MLRMVICLWAAITVSATVGQAGGKPPNIVVILADDLPMDLMPVMVKTRALVADRGATFTRYFVQSPGCCPSRVTLLRGQYDTNHGCFFSNAPKGCAYRQKAIRNDRQTIATQLAARGYHTALVGKYLNSYETVAPYIPPGWTSFHGLMMGKKKSYSAFSFNHNGRIREYTGEAYMTDLIADLGVEQINTAAAGGKPLFLLIAPFAPHAPFTAAPRHRAAAIPPLIPAPSFGEADTNDKPTWIGTSPAFTGTTAAKVSQLYQMQAQASLALDDLVERIVSALEAKGILDNSYVIFTSDNGFHRGDHRIVRGKGYPYERSVHVPFALRGPGIAPGSRMDQFGMNVDLAPTILEWAGAAPLPFFEGRSLAPLVKDSRKTTSWRRAVFTHNRHADSNRGQEDIIPEWFAFRTAEYTYVEYHDGQRELYDLARDPDEMENIFPSQPETIQEALAYWAYRFASCRGQECRDAEETVPVNLKQMR
ncbi:MAG: sulfatase [Nitrospinae bacterium]|nr:sulfatase [Nitrospinota bacterium]